MNEEKDNEQRAVHIDIKTVRRNERSIRVMKRLIAFLVVVLVGIGLYISYPYWLPKLEGIFDKPLTTIDNSGKIEGGNFPIAADEAALDVFTLKNHLVAADAHRLTIYDENGKRRGSYDHDFSSPVVRSSGKRALVFDFGSTGFKLYNKNGEVYSKAAENDIMSAALGEDGTAAILVTSDKYASTVLYYNKEGKLIYRYDSTKKVMAVYVTPDGRSSYVCTFSSEQGEIYSQVVRLDLNENGEQMISEEIECLAIGCVLCDDGNIQVAGDNGLFVLSGDGKKIAEYEYSGELIDFTLNEECSAVILSGSTKNSGKLIIAESGAADGKTFREIACDNTVKQVDVCAERVLLLTSSNVAAYSYDGSEAGRAQLDKEYYRFTYINSALYLSGKHGIDKIKFEM